MLAKMLLVRLTLHATYAYAYGVIGASYTGFTIGSGPGRRGLVATGIYATGLYICCWLPFSFFQ